MHLAGQGETARRQSEHGYAMAGLLVGLAVMAVLMTVAMPVWKQTVQREKEEELVFRGEQYAHAIGMFQRKSANNYPPNLDVLVQQKFLRKKYIDPVTNDDFVPLAQQAQAAQRGAQPGQAQQGQAQQGQGRGQTGTTAPGAAPQNGTPAGGVIGVTSKSTNTSIRLYKGRSHYNEWAFIYTPPAQAPGAGGAAGAGTAGAGGRGQGQGQPGANGPGGGFGRGGRGQFQSGGNGTGRSPQAPNGTTSTTTGPGPGR